MKTKKAILTMALLVGSATAGADIVIGDSISATRTSWPAVLQSQGGWWKNLAQSLRFGIGYKVPADLKTYDGHKRVVYALGSNDSALINMGLVTIKDFTPYFYEHMLALHGAGFKVLIIIPPTVPARNQEAIRKHQLDYCAVISAYGVPNIKCFDPDSIGYYNNTRDGLHPTDAFSVELAYAIQAELDGDWP